MHAVTQPPAYISVFVNSVNDRESVKRFILIFQEASVGFVWPRELNRLTYFSRLIAAIVLCGFLRKNVSILAYLRVAIWEVR